MTQMRIMGLAAALGATAAMAGCPADDSDGDDSMAVATGVSMASTMTATDTPTTDAPTGEESGTMESSSTGTPMTDLTSADMQVIWDASCVTDCHDATATGEVAWPSLPMTADVAYANLFDEDGLQTMAIEELKLIAPFDTANSYILDKLRGTQKDRVGIAGASQMPLDRVDPTMSTPLDEATIGMIEEWIAGGAPE